jgi:hypothetical protein
MKLTDEEKMRLREDLDPDTFRTILKCMQIEVVNEKERYWNFDGDAPNAKAVVHGMMKLKNNFQIMVQKINKGEKNA